MSLSNPQRIRERTRSVYHATRAEPLSPVGSRLWKTAQIAAWGVTLLLVAGLIIRPEPSLRLAWYGIVPLLPASFLLNAGLWRGLCPIATANTVASRSAPSGILSGRSLIRAAMAGLVLLALLVPARHILLNQNGPVLAGLLLAIVAAAFIAGRYVSAKGGFCNAVCPVLPVEKLYGQSPLIEIRNPRCVPCTLCTTRGCVDVDPDIALQHGMTSAKGQAGWIRTPLGAFSAAFPGFIIGYFQVSDVPFSEAASVYAIIGLGALISYIVVAVLALGFRIDSRIGAPILAALSIGSYYWFAVPASFETFAWPAPVGEVVRAAILGFVVFWLVVALRRQRMAIRLSTPVGAVHPAPALRS